MHVIVGLGNPEEKYFGTRHNMGFVLVEKLAELLQIEFKNSKNLSCAVAKTSNILLAKPQTFMNSSGLGVVKLLKYYALKPNILYVSHDDLDLPLGEYKIQLARGPKVHGGINSIENSLATKDFWRVRIGVDNRDPSNRIAGEAYVLQKFSLAEEEIINKVIASAAAEILSLLK